MNLLIFGALAPSQLAVGGLDPIQLIRGVQVLGNPAFSTIYMRHEYHFSNSSNLAEFKKQPTKYAAQNGGACGRMGALSGKGSPSLYEVVNGKLYFFASESCRSTFLKSPEKFISRAPLKEPSLFSSTSLAEQAWARVLNKHNPGKRPTNISWTVFTPYKDEAVEKVWRSHRFVGNNSRLAMWEEWDAGRSFFLRDGNRFAEGKPGEFFDMHPDERNELVEYLGSNIPGFLLGYAKPMETAAGTITVKVGQRVITVNVESELITGISFEDHIGGPLTKVEIRYSAFGLFGGALLPTEIQQRTNGGAWGLPKKETSYLVDGALPVVFGDIKSN